MAHPFSGKTISENNRARNIPVAVFFFIKAPGLRYIEHMERDIQERLKTVRANERVSIVGLLRFALVP